MKPLVFLVASAILASSLVAQTNPSAQTLPYTQDFSSLAHSSTTYPTGWQGWTLSGSPGGTFNTAAPASDRALTGSSTAATFLPNVNNYNGKIGFLSDIATNLGIVLAINTTGKAHIAVSYDVMTIRNPYNGVISTRINEATLQYRVGTSGIFTNLTGIEYQNNTTLQTGSVTTPQNLQSKTILLPVSCENQPVVQLRWVSRDVSGGSGRPSFAFDAINITSSSFVTDVLPVQNAIDVSPATTLQVTFNEAMSPGLFNDTTSFIVSGMTSGRYRGTFGFSGGNTIVTFTPSIPFKKGETVIVNLSSNLVSSGSSVLLPFAYTFNISVDASGGGFANPVDYATGPSDNRSVFVYDLDSDGDGDLAVTNLTGDKVSILKNNGNGTFAPKVEYTSGSQPVSVVVSDLDGDGDGDLAVANYSASTVSILKNNGNGTFALKTDYVTDANPSSIFIGDVDGDGDGDLALTSITVDVVSILKNNGNGTFAPKVDYASGSQPVSVAVSDLDGDGDMDLAVANDHDGFFQSSFVSILKNNGNGTFAPRIAYNICFSPSSILVSDLDGDGDGDIVTADNGWESSIYVAMNNGDGAFSTGGEYLIRENGFYSIFVSDLDGDGDGDLCVRDGLGQSIQIMKNNGEGIFGEKTRYTIEGFLTSVFVSDVDNDGIGDIVVTSYETVSIMRGGTRPVITAVSPAMNALDVLPTTTIQATFNQAMLPASFNDTTSFIVSGMTSGRHQGTFSFTGGNTIATFTPMVPFTAGEIVTVDVSNKLTTPDNFSPPQKLYTFTIAVENSVGVFDSVGAYGTNLFASLILVHDLDSDGDGDLVVLSEGEKGFPNDYFSVFKNNGNGTFATRVDYPILNGALGTSISDVDGDGDGDFVHLNYDVNAVYVHKNNGDGTFGTSNGYLTGDNPRAAFVNDLDGDGDGDLGVTSYTAGTVSILKNNGNGTFAEKVDYAIGGAYSIHVSDMDGDGDGDLVFGISGGYSIMKNEGDGTFAPKVDYMSGVSPLGVSDLDGDGDEDWVMISSSSDIVSIVKNNGDGTFAPKVDYAVGDYPSSVFISDIDGDGDADLIVGSDSESFSVLKNDGNGEFLERTDYPSARPFRVFASDLDGDSVVDLIFSHYWSSRISIWKGINTNHTITASSGANGSISPSGPVTISVGTDTTFTFTPNPGYDVDSILVDGVYAGDSLSYRFSNVTTNHAIHAIFTVNTAIFSITPGSLSIGDVLVGASNTDSVTVTNTGSSPLSIYSMSTNNAEFSIVVATTAELKPGNIIIPPGGSERIDVTFAPASAGVKTAALSFVHNAAGSPDTVSLEGTGYGLPPVAQGWNVLSVPYELADYLTTVVYPTATSSAFAYVPGMGYQQRDTLVNGEGIWIKFPSGQPLTVSGTAIPSDTVSVVAGWNLVGTVGQLVPVADIGTIGTTIVSPFYVFSGGYVPADPLVPGNGYWVKVSQAGSLVIGSATVPQARPQEVLQSKAVK